MGLLTNPIQKILAGVGNLTAIRRGLLDKRETLLQRLDELHALPLAKPDIIDALNGAINNGRADYLERLQTQLGAYLRNGRGIEGIPPNFPVMAPNSGMGHNAIIPAAIMALLGEQIKETLAKIVGDLDLPEAGPTLAERRAEIERIDKELSKIEAELAEIESAARAAGVSLLQ